MTAQEVYELTTQGGATDFARLIRACESFGDYCLIGGLAVNCFVEPIGKEVRPTDKAASVQLAANSRASSQFVARPE